MEFGWRMSGTHAHAGYPSQLISLTKEHECYCIMHLFECYFASTALFSLLFSQRRYRIWSHYHRRRYKTRCFLRCIDAIAAATATGTKVSHDTASVSGLPKDSGGGCGVGYCHSANGGKWRRKGLGRFLGSSVPSIAGSVSRNKLACASRLLG